MSALGLGLGDRARLRARRVALVRTSMTVRRSFSSAPDLTCSKVEACSSMMRFFSVAWLSVRLARSSFSCFSRAAIFRSLASICRGLGLG